LALALRQKVKKAMLVVCGIDPGTDGAIAFLADGEVERIVNYPTLQLKKGSKKRSLDYHGLCAVFDAPRPDHAFVEETWNRPGEGHSGALVGYYMATLGVLAALKIPWTGVSPQAWKRYFRVPKDSTPHKELSRQRANQLMPRGEEYWTPRRLVMTKAQAGGRAEAALICLYGLRALPGSVGLSAVAA
jgi:hypothetical protein